MKLAAGLHFDDVMRSKDAEHLPIERWKPLQEVSIAPFTHRRAIQPGQLLTLYMKNVTKVSGKLVSCSMAHPVNDYLILTICM